MSFAIKKTRLDLSFDPVATSRWDNQVISRPLLDNALEMSVKSVDFAENYAVFTQFKKDLSHFSQSQKFMV